MSVETIYEGPLFEMKPGGPRKWRVGRKVPLNVYEGSRPVCQCHNPEDAQRIVDAMNAALRSTILGGNPDSSAEGNPNES